MGNDSEKAVTYAGQSYLVVAGLKAPHHGHVVVIVPGAAKPSLGLLGALRWDRTQEHVYQLVLETLRIAGGQVFRHSVQLGSPVMKAIHILTIAFTVYTSSALGQACAYKTLEPGVGKAQVGASAIDLGAGDDPVKPQAWQGPVMLTHADGTSCTVDPDVSLVERPLFTDGQRVVISTYSGSERGVYFLDINSCRTLWKSPPFSGGVSLTAQTLRLGKKRHKLGSLCVPSGGSR
ncbi:hypothetical protein [Nitrospirillum amazonense]|uniref:hypothetical protein n=1 Tax=Nitrospirillum amazonense TaxID=28077 RepID=UPI0024125460|nr:hypothetical protein [Nitrospirillum amazonense]MDG3444424.1 hypothetical protein [Nitrospirillum amazonense]